MAAIAAAAAFAAPAAAMARPGFVTTKLYIRAGPSTSFPVVDTLPSGARVDIHGCLSGYTWCDVSWRGERGWVAARYLDFVYRGRRVFLPEYAVEVGFPIVSFSVGSYWNNYYRHRRFYHRRNYFERHFRGHRRHFRRERRQEHRRFRHERRQERRQFRHEQRQERRQERRHQRRNSVHIIPPQQNNFRGNRHRGGGRHGHARRNMISPSNRGGGGGGHAARPRASRPAVNMGGGHRGGGAGAHRGGGGGQGGGGVGVRIKP
jgi:uncharacterized protein YraI